MNIVAQGLELHRLTGTYREVQVVNGLIDFSSNDYLGLSQCPRIKAKLITELENGCPIGATGSRLLSGQTKYHEQVEQFLEETFSAPSALLFSSGFSANLGVLSTFSSLDPVFFSDEKNHASLVDGMRFSKSEKKIFRHNDLNHLEDLLKKCSHPLKVIVTESVFSMDGDLTPLSELFKLAERYDAWLIVDEAHATGIFGECGLGRIVNACQLTNKTISIHTGGKALGGQGGFVLSSREFRKLLINRARSFIFSTALSPLNALQIKYAIMEIIKNPIRGATLLRSVEKWRSSFPQYIDTLDSKSQIIPVVVGSNEKALKVSVYLQKKGFDVRPIRSPTVAVGTERLRITAKCFHLPADLERFLEALKEAVA